MKSAHTKQIPNRLQPSSDGTLKRLFKRLTEARDSARNRAASPRPSEANSFRPSEETDVDKRFRPIPPLERPKPVTSSAAPDRDESEVSESAAPEHRPVSFAAGRTSRGVRPAVYALAILGGAVLSLMGYLLFTDSYRARTDLLITFGGTDDEAAERSFSREIRRLRSPALLHLTAHDVYTDRLLGTTGLSDTSEKRDTWGIAASNGAAGLPDPVKFVRLLADNLEITAERENQTAVVSLSGDDPAFVKTVLQSFVEQYKAETRKRSVGPRSEPPPPAALRDVAGARSRLKQLDAELHAVESKRKECRLALQLMKSGSGVFRGFAPADPSETSTPLGKFQSRIVELEIKKKALSPTFNPSSREVRAVEEEIRAVRESMKDWIRASLVFLTQKENALLSEKRNLEHAIRRAARPVESDKDEKTTNVGPDRASKTASVPYVIESPLTVHKPALVVASEYSADLYRRAGDGVRIAFDRIKREFTSFPFACRLDHLDRKRNVEQPAPAESPNTDARPRRELQSDAADALSSPDESITE